MLHKGRRAASLGAITVTDDGDFSPTGEGTNTHTYASTASTGPYSLVCLTWGNISARSISGVTWGGVAMTEVVAINGVAAVGYPGAAIFGIAGAQTGDIVATFSGLTSRSHLTVTSLSRAGTLHDSASARGSNSAQAFSNLSCSSGNGATICVMCHDTDGGAGTTWNDVDGELVDVADSGQQHTVAYKYGSYSTGVIDWSVGSSDDFAQVGAAWI